LLYVYNCIIALSLNEVTQIIHLMDRGTCAQKCGKLYLHTKEICVHMAILASISVNIFFSYFHSPILILQISYPCSQRIKSTRLPHKPGMWNWNPSFKLQFHHLKVWGSSSKNPKLLRSISTAWFELQGKSM